jgi:putative YhdH/YhfP family quinone oxidoreductase
VPILSDHFTCLLVSADTTPEKTVTAAVTQRDTSELPEGDVTIHVEYSSLNYKDALATQGHPGVVRRLPHIPGIDAAGTVVQCAVAESAVDTFAPGDQVLVTGFDLGAGHWGGHAEYVRVPAGWVVPLPAGLTPREAMIFGTAGFTAARSLCEIVDHGVRPDDGELLVTGASGGVGSLAVAMAARAGYRVVAATGKADAHEWLVGLGAARIIDRRECVDSSGRALLSSKWAGVIDTVGGDILATALRSASQHGCVTACGMVAGDTLSTSVFPFILRGITLAGIDSSQFPIDRRGEVWRHMAEQWRPADLESLVFATTSLEGLGDYVAQILAGGIRGRVLVELPAKRT